MPMIKEVIILPQIDEAYDREHIDMNYFGIDQFIDTTLKPIRHLCKIR